MRWFYCDDVTVIYLSKLLEEEQSPADFGALIGARGGIDELIKSTDIERNELVEVIALIHSYHFARTFLPRICAFNGKPRRF